MYVSRRQSYSFQGYPGTVGTTISTHIHTLHARLPLYSTLLYTRILSSTLLHTTYLLYTVYSLDREERRVELLACIHAYLDVSM